MRSKGVSSGEDNAFNNDEAVQMLMMSPKGIGPQRMKRSTYDDERGKRFWSINNGTETITQLLNASINALAND
jgi:hypothetical protein